MDLCWQIRPGKRYMTWCAQALLISPTPGPNCLSPSRHCPSTTLVHPLTAFPMPLHCPAGTYHIQHVLLLLPVCAGRCWASCQCTKLLWDHKEIYSTFKTTSTGSAHDRLVQRPAKIVPYKETHNKMSWVLSNPFDSCDVLLLDPSRNKYIGLIILL